MAARKGNKYAKGNRGGGRPSLYKSRYVEIAQRMCAQGATRDDLADRFGVNVKTIDAWIFEHEEFSGACKVGQAVADDRVERALYEKAIGFTYDSEKLMVLDSMIYREPIKVYVPPDRGAAEFWLRNRRKDQWKDAKKLETSLAEEDPFLTFLKSINGKVLRPVDNPPAVDPPDASPLGENQ